MSSTVYVSFYKTQEDVLPITDGSLLKGVARMCFCKPPKCSSGGGISTDHFLAPLNEFAADVLARSMDFLKVRNLHSARK